MKIVFLDFDGVIVRGDGDYLKQEESVHDVGSPEWYAEVFDPTCMENLNRIVAKTGAKVVISSAWRGGRSILDLRKILTAAGFKGEVIGKTRNGKRGEEREEQIADWINDGNNLYDLDIENFVIIDDDNDMPSFPLSFVKTKWEKGLTVMDTAQAIRILTFSML